MKKGKKGSMWYMVEAIALAFSLLVFFLVSKLTDNVSRYELHTKLTGGTVQASESVQPEASHINEKDDITVKTKAPKNVSYRNIALFGVDSRDGQLLAGTRSDTMIIASINEKTKEVKLVSVYRDSFLNIGEDTYNKANAAYAFGGPTQAVDMLNRNLDLDISDYVTVGFSGLIDTVDAIGGIDINIEEEEIQYLNSYQICMAEELGLEYTPIENSGLQTLNGIQTTAYCRIRYTAGSDFKRTQRQRNVIIQILEKSKTMSIMELNKAVDAVLPKVSTSLSIGEIIQLVSTSSQYVIVDNTGVPFMENLAGANVGRKGSCVIPYDLCENVEKLHAFLYDINDYEPSETVKQYNQQIRLQTADYLGW